ncbi:class I SAM-dependent methyltransferase [Actinoplanes sp. NPDC020271]|uniref:class I SAM-dependent methyltransferase n=1 Tax=Actinoplanes sp. NPDC020271 TaxID=3363896 RepID=UPI0037B3968B
MLAAIHDDHTRRLIRTVGCAPDAIVLDAGAGTGSISLFVATELLGPQAGGRVDALDVDPQHLPQHERIRVRAENIVTADLGDGVYDLIHARLLLMDLPERDDVLARMVRALQPGGRLIISDWDCQNSHRLLQTDNPAATRAFAVHQQALARHAVATGRAPGWAATISSALLRHRLQLITSAIHVPGWTGCHPGLQWYHHVSLQQQEMLLTTGVNHQQLDLLRGALADPRTVGYCYPLYTAVGVQGAAS